MLLRLKPIVLTLLLVWWLPFSVPLLAELLISEALLQRIENEYDSEARQRVEAWQILMQENQDLSEREKLAVVNDFFNSNVLFVDDIFLWNKEDYWATPIEMLSLGAGDCEDYSIAKYFTLKQLGVDEDKLRITYVKAIDLNQAHMVLTYFENKRAIPLVLDNLINEIQPASRRQDLTPVYSFNGTGLWLAKSRGEGQRVGDASRLSLWEDLAARMRAETVAD
ncbi:MULTISPECIES: transglutaminase-like cysteine peptidase [unclassified Methylophaga]|jgi:predicted transglutaminase-like cysteine proteinase|uniref:transglutaminase-like cysteine peptidase n=1 Tax=unclassified Methylophaga TaxID=2629249 RepID=UPI000C49420F|nr:MULTISPECIES: transglutaminase-like cysteine peptidase [unclassified Methylophaga]MAL48178.1 sulfate adenylyltransferase [Methylophaga sp.]MAP25593.1 sulfate adenylyltransferase [Methylophaga sp.]MBP24185.1 sulfate adenylyltransferase [Methylophaga sp.]MDX1749960.1 transglutaminase-like cysteine peptidase [Methylophaga sp.]HAD30277.1 sulfate adenylyltransferase [Methylophaga sp.]|tara:strand:+ start:850 stop:1518 length:669 start_codon:yes stop_codon:yes gene_type:complete